MCYSVLDPSLSARLGPRLPAFPVVGRVTSSPHKHSVLFLRFRVPQPSPHSEPRLPFQQASSLHIHDAVQGVCMGVTHTSRHITGVTHASRELRMPCHTGVTRFMSHGSYAQPTSHHGSYTCLMSHGSYTCLMSQWACFGGISRKWNFCERHQSWKENVVL